MYLACYCLSLKCRDAVQCSAESSKSTSELVSEFDSIACLCIQWGTVYVTQSDEPGIWFFIPASGSRSSTNINKHRSCVSSLARHKINPEYYFICVYLFDVVQGESEDSLAAQTKRGDHVSLQASAVMWRWSSSGGSHGNKTLLKAFCFCIFGADQFRGSYFAAVWYNSWSVGFLIDHIRWVVYKSKGGHLYLWWVFILDYTLFSRTTFVADFYTGANMYRIIDDLYGCLNLVSICANILVGGGVKEIIWTMLLN